MAVSLVSNPQLAGSTSCPHCFSPVDHSGRFCGECGAPTSPAKRAAQQAAVLTESNFAASFQRTPTVMHAHETHSHPTHQPHQAHATPPPANTRAMRAVHERAPSFAALSQKAEPKEIPHELKDEISRLVCLLARERFFLIMHWCIFLALNMTGLTLSLIAYNGYIGDELTKTVIALTPLMFINTIALACLAPIKGTKREIARVKERLSYVRFQVEYSNLF